MDKVELLSPVGSYEAFIGAINAGADAFYLSLKKFGARAYADNFTVEELNDVIDTAHLFKKKVYLTLNTLIKEEEMNDVKDQLYEPYHHGLDAVIVQDIGLVRYIAREFPDLPIHISTQMSVTEHFSSEALKKYNVKRLIPARELSLNEVSALKEGSGMEIECFIHGSMCYSYSGKCLMSSFLGGRSGNRGRCAQPCRLPYSVADKKECYPLSMADMCTVGMIEELINSGIDSFKIEGRMKKPVYSSYVTSVYRKYIDKFYDGTYKGVSKEDLDELKKMYIRTEIGEGYYKRKNGPSMITMDSPSYSGSDDDLVKSCEERFLKKKPVIGIFMEVKIQSDKPVVISTLCYGIGSAYVGPVPEKAQKAPLKKEVIIKQMSKTGNTFFVPEKIDVLLDDGLFMSVSSLNEIRRASLEALKTELLKCHQR
ncbi:MAG: U32 family peptidase [Lachnospiraceae bacterium]|nr:U32 family peptidase [Lachnospiraceae bacterium]